MNDREHRLSHYVGLYFERVLTGDCWFTAVDLALKLSKQSDIARMRTEQQRRYIGIKPSHLDWYVYQRETGIFGQLELKIGRNTPTVGQGTTMRLLRERKIPTGCAWTLPQVHDWTRESGFLMHANARNIMNELRERLMAADREAELKINHVPGADIDVRAIKRGEKRRAQALMPEDEFENIVLGGMT